MIWSCTLIVLSMFVYILLEFSHVILIDIKHFEFGTGIGLKARLAYDLSFVIIGHGHLCVIVVISLSLFKFHLFLFQNKIECILWFIFSWTRRLIIVIDVLLWLNSLGHDLFKQLDFFLLLHDFIKYLFFLRWIWL